MENEIIYNSKEEQKATERVLSIFKIKEVNEQIDKYVAEMLKFAANIDKILERNNISKRYLEKVSEIGEGETLTLDDDLNSIDFRVKEVVEDLIKRINTRIDLIKDNTKLIEEIENTYDLKNADLDKDIKTAHLTKEDFAE